MALSSFAGSSTLPAFLQPAQGKNLYAGNYLNFLDGSVEQWAQQFLPDVYDKEVEIYGNRTISGFLKMVSAEMPSTSDQIIWLEQGRLHTRYTGASIPDGAVAAGTTVTITAATASVPGPGRGFGSAGTSTTTEGSNNNAFNFRTGQTVMMQSETAGESLNASLSTIKGVVTGVADDGTTADIGLYQAKEATSSATVTVLVYGSEFAKGTGNFEEKIDPSYSTYSNAPIIMKEHYSINGSDTGQIGWIEVTSENGASGYLWYVKAEHENRLRWEDYIEMSMIEGVTQAAGTTGVTLMSHRNDNNGVGGPSSANRAARGTEGFFQALRTRGNLYDNLSGELVAPDARGTAGSFTYTGAMGLHAFDNILRQLDKQGSIEENMLYTDRDLALAFDDMLSQQADAASGLGTSWGIFNNSKDMALNLGFSGFRRGSYDFYKTDWKYLNDFSTRGGFGDIEGVMIPAGTSTVYDQNLGKNIKRPFLHVRYRASETDNRKMKSWITGSVGGAYTTDIDEMRMHYLTERCLITQGANNFFLFTDLA